MKKIAFVLALALCALSLCAEDIPALQPEQVTALQDYATQIAVRANVRKAAVFLNGNFEGVSPVTLRNLMRGQYHLRVEKTGYEAQDYLITVDSGCAQTYYIDLKKQETPAE